MHSHLRRSTRRGVIAHGVIGALARLNSDSLRRARRSLLGRRVLGDRIRVGVAHPDRRRSFRPTGRSTELGADDEQAERVVERRRLVQMHGRPAGDRSRQHPRTARQSMPRPPSRNASKPDGAQQVLRPLAVADEEFHRQQIEQAFASSRETPYFDLPNFRGRCLTTTSPVRKPLAAASTGTKRCSSPYSRISCITSRRNAFRPQL